MSLRQVDLMCADCAVTIYPKTDSVKDGKGKVHKFVRPSASSIEHARKEFESGGKATNVKVDLSGFSFS